MKLSKFIKKYAKNQPINFSSWLLLLLIFIIFPINFAHAYLDPGSGNYIIQILIGAILGGAYAIKTYYKRIYLYFQRRFGKKKDKK